MCRAPMCFKGMIGAKKTWRKEKQVEVYVELVKDIFEEMEEEYQDVLLQCLEVVQNRFEYVSHKYPNITLDELDFVLRVTWIDIDYLMNESYSTPEPKTFMKYLLVSKYAGVNRKHLYHNSLQPWAKAL
jgi:hypothetical protein